MFLKYGFVRKIPNFYTIDKRKFSQIFFKRDTPKKVKEKFPFIVFYIQGESESLN